MRKNSDKAVKVFFDELQWMQTCHSRAVLAVMMCVSFMTNKNSAEFYLSPEDRRELLTELNLSRSSLSTAMSALVEKKVIAPLVDNEGKKRNGHYVLNPVMFWYGDLYRRRSAVDKYWPLFYGEDE